MPKFWLFQYIDGSWGVERWKNRIPNLRHVHDLVEIRLVEAHNAADAMRTVDEWDEDGGMNKEAAVILKRNKVE